MSSIVDFCTLIYHYEHLCCWNWGGLLLNLLKMVHTQLAHASWGDRTCNFTPPSGIECHLAYNPANQVQDYRD